MTEDEVRALPLLPEGDSILTEAEVRLLGALGLREGRMNGGTDE